MSEFIGKMGTAACSGPRTVSDIFAPAMTEANPSSGNGSPVMIKIIFNLGGKKKRRKTLADLAMGEEDDD